MSFEGQDTLSPLLVRWRAAKSTTSGTSLLRHQQRENRFPSVKIFITIHQPKSFLSPQLWNRTKACLLLQDETCSSQAPCSPLFTVSCTSIHGPLYVLQAVSRQVLKCCLLSYTLLLGIRSRVFYVVWRARHAFSLTCKVKNGQINPSATSLLRHQQGENRFPSVKIFITIHQPKSFLSP